LVVALTLADNAAFGWLQFDGTLGIVSRPVKVWSGHPQEGEWASRRVNFLFGGSQLN
jgi:hypothetical protein